MHSMVSRLEALLRRGVHVEARLGEAAVLVFILFYTALLRENKSHRGWQDSIDLIECRFSARR